MPSPKIAANHGLHRQWVALQAVVKVLARAFRGPGILELRGVVDPSFPKAFPTVPDTIELEIKRHQGTLDFRENVKAAALGDKQYAKAVLC